MIRGDFIKLKQNDTQLSDIFEIRPEDIVVFYYYPDTNYDHKTEDLGMFYGIIYEKDGKFFWNSANPKNFEFIRKILDSASDTLTEYNNSEAFRFYIGKKYINNFRIKNSKCIFLEKYVLVGEDDHCIRSYIEKRGRNKSTTDIKLIDILNLSDEKFSKLKLIFNSDWDYDPNVVVKEMKDKFGNEPFRFELLKMYGHGKADLVNESVKTHNPNGRKRFKNGEFVLCFIPFSNKDWLLVSAYKVLDENKFLIDVDESELSELSGLIGRLVVTWADRNTMNIVMKDKDVISRLTVKTILERPYYEIEKTFPGYENVDLSWNELKYVLKTETWKTALENQKGVYLITDTKTNKRYVGSAYGENMILGRWLNYAENGHGGNLELKRLVSEQSLDYIKNNFRYSILDIYKSTTDDKTILARESWWKEVLLTRNPKFGYNAN